MYMDARLLKKKLTLVWVFFKACVYAKVLEQTLCDSSSGPKPQRDCLFGIKLKYAAYFNL